MLEHFIGTHRDAIVVRCRAKVATRLCPAPTDAELDHGIPLFLDQLMDALRLNLESNPDLARRALHQRHELLLKGFTLPQVVRGYGDACQSIAELAIETNAALEATDLHALNTCLDEATAGAVAHDARERDQSTLDVTTTRGRERLGFFVHELRNLVNTSLAAFEVLRTGNVGVAGSTGAVLQRSLTGLRGLINRSLAEVRLTQGIQSPEQFSLAEFIAEVAATAELDAHSRGVGLTVTAIDEEVAVEADRQVLAAAVGNLLQNALKFTRPETGVTLRVGGSLDRVLIEIEDECGGLPGGNADDLFQPFEQRGTDRTGLGLGLAISRWGVEANRGRIHARNLPGRGCIFTVDLPRLQFPALSPDSATASP